MQLNSQVPKKVYTHKAVQQLFNTYTKQDNWAVEVHLLFLIWMQVWKGGQNITTDSGEVPIITKSLRKM